MQYKRDKSLQTDCLCSWVLLRYITFSMNQQSVDGTMQTARKLNELYFTNANTIAGNYVTVQFTIDDSGMIHAEITQRYGDNPLVPDAIMCSMQTQAFI